MGSTIAEGGNRRREGSKGVEFEDVAAFGRGSGIELGLGGVSEGSTGFPSCLCCIGEGFRENRLRGRGGVVEVGTGSLFVSSSSSSSFIRRLLYPLSEGDLFLLLDSIGGVNERGSGDLDRFLELVLDLDLLDANRDTGEGAAVVVVEAKRGPLGETTVSGISPGEYERDFLRSVVLDSR